MPGLSFSKTSVPASVEALSDFAASARAPLAPTIAAVAAAVSSALRSTGRPSHADFAQNGHTHSLTRKN